MQRRKRQTARTALHTDHAAVLVHCPVEQVSVASPEEEILPASGAVAFGTEIGDGWSWSCGVMIGVLLLVSQVPREAGMIDGHCGAPSFFLSAFSSSTGTALDKRASVARPPYVPDLFHAYG
jgi:hypothetical protein